MTWIRNLSDLYDFAMDSEDDLGEQKLVPIGNMVQNTQIELIINKDSEFLRAQIIEKEKSQTILPCTIESSVRTSAPRPHLLYDNISYLAGDLKNYIEDEEKAEKAYNEFHIPYIEQLKDWIVSDKNHEYAETIYKYLTKGTLTKDLISSGLLELDENNKLADIKIEGISQDKVVIRIAIEKEGKLIKPWELMEFLKLSGEYYLSTLEDEDKSLCYSTGKILFITPVHGKYIRFAGDGSKLLSSNDNTNFTFRGRFDTADECAQISYEASEKAHSALRWIIRKQGKVNDGYTVVSWSDRNSEIPQVLDDSDDFIDILLDTDDALSKKSINTGNIYAKELNKAVGGYKARLTKDENIYVIALNSATPGRLSILYYRELNGGEFIQRLEQWYKSISWLHKYKKDSETNKLYSFYGAASPIDIIKAAFGVQRGEFMDLDNKVLNKQIERLLPCIVDGKRVPIDFVMGAYRNGTNPVSKNYYNWNKCLTISCGLSKKYYKERMGEEIDMKLDKENNNRSYLFGRLLAVAYRIEEVYYYHNNIDRTPTALRLMESMSKRPYKTWSNLQLRLVPYLQSLKANNRKYYINLIDDIMVKFNDGDFSKNRPLEPKFLMGFHSQHEELRTYAKDENKDLNNLEEDK